MNEATRVNSERSEAIQRIRGVFESADFSQIGIERLLGCSAPLPPIALRIPGECLGLEGFSPLETLVRLFLLSQTLPIDPVQRALAPSSLDDWVQAGVVRATSQEVEPTVRIMPYSGLLIACDRRTEPSQSDSREFVMGPGRSSLILAESTIRSEVESCLDLGMGNGIQSLLAARHCTSVCGVDLNPRALDYARFNARLNQIDQIEFLEGDLCEPLSARPFDLIVSNPPYVISPDCNQLYSDNPDQADGFCERLARQAARHLNPLGVFQMYFDWAHVKGQRAQERLAQWCQDSGCDGWVMRKETRAPVEYIRTWNRFQAGTPESDEFFSRWMSYYEELGIEAISTGLLTMRRRDNVQNWFRADDGPETAIAPIGDDIRLLLDTTDWLDSQRDADELLRARFQIPEHVRMDQQLLPTPEGWQVQAAQLRRTTGLGYTHNLAPDTAQLLYQCNGQKSLGELLHLMAARRGVSAAEIAPAQINVVQHLLSRGFLTVARDTSDCVLVDSAAALAGQPVAEATNIHIC